MSRANVSILALTLIVVMFLGIAASKCGRNHPSDAVTKIVADSTATAADSSKVSPERKKARRQKNKTAGKKETRREPSSRRYLDEPVD